MLRLIYCELLKLKRKRFLQLSIAAAFLFPIPLTYLMTTPGMLDRFGREELFDTLFHFMLGYAVELLLPCVIGVVAAMLFFMERDNDTFKNLRTIPVTSTQMILAKITVLFLFGVLFCLLSVGATILCGLFVPDMPMGGFGAKLLLSVKMGVFITAGALPLVVLVVFFSRTYIFSVLLCIFYSVLSLSAESLITQLPRTLCWGMPIVLINMWTAGEMKAQGYSIDLKQLEPLIPTTAQAAAIIGGMAAVSFLLIDILYKRRGEQ